MQYFEYENKHENVFDSRGNVVQIIQEIAHRHANGTAIIDTSGDYAYSDLERDSDKIAAYLLQLGLEPESLIVVLLEASYLFVATTLGILKAGYAYVPVDPDYPIARIEFLIADSKSKLVIANANTKEKIPLGNVQAVDIKLDVLDRISTISHQNFPEITSHSLAYVIYTSGSTGKPKGVMIGHQALLASTISRVNFYHDYKVKKFILIPSISFDSSIAVIYWSLMTGGTIVIPNPSMKLDVLNLVEFIAESKITHILCVPVLYQLILDNIPANKALSLELAIIAGDNFKSNLIESHSLKLPQATLVNEYGPTEATVWSTCAILYNSINGLQEKHVTIGKPLSHCYVYVVDQHMRQISNGEGELLIGGASVAKGYLNLADLTKEKFIKNPFRQGENYLYRTGDIVKINSDGNLEYLSRNDRQVKISGYRIEIPEIEVSILAIPEVKDVTVFIGNGNQDCKRLGCVIIAKSDEVAGNTGKEKALEHKIRQHLSTELYYKMLPIVIHFSRSFPLTPNLKIDYKKLEQELFVAPTETTSAINLYNSKIETDIADIWSAVLKINNIPRNHSFFSLGGDSIMAIQLVASCRRRGYAINVRDLYLHDTIEKMSRLFSNNTQAQPQPQEFHQFAHGVVSLTPIQKWFFCQKFQNPNHWNQSILIKLSIKTDLLTLRKCFANIISHHEMLRAAYTLKEEAVIQEVRAVNQINIDDIVSQESCENSPVVFEYYSKRANSEIDLYSGRLLRVLLLNCTDETQALCVCIHHLIIDGVSWRILIDQLESELQSKEQVTQNNRKTSSFKEWSDFLYDYSNSSSLMLEQPYWTRHLQRESYLIDGDSLSMTKGQTINIVESLDNDLSYQLIHSIHYAYQTRINDILLSALMLAMRSWKNKDALTFLLEGHGREDLSASIDISRTIGWFTSVFPAHLNISGMSGLSDIIQSVKQQLAEIPNNGIGYGIIRYLRQNQVGDSKLIASEFTPDLIFNYLGQWSDQVNAGNNSCSFLSLPGVDSISDENTKETKIDINCLYLNGKFTTQITFSANEFEEKSIRQFLSHFQSAIVSLIRHCAEIRMTNTQLASSHCEFQLSPMQESMLYRSLLEPNTDEYIVQNIYNLSDAIDVERFKLAWMKAISEHDGLRAQFSLSKGSNLTQNYPDQVVLPWNEADLSVFSGDELSLKLSDYIASDRLNKFDLTVAPLFRLHLLRTSHNQFIFVFTHHHILLDGWSTTILIEQIIQNYTILNTKKFVISLVGEKPPSFKRYLSWYMKLEKQMAQTFWRKTLHGIGAFSYLSEIKQLLEYNQKDNNAPHQILKFNIDEMGVKLDILRTFCMQNGLTLNTLLTAAWGVLLSWYLQTNDVIFGLTVSGRSVEFDGAENLIGLLINTLPIRMQISAESTVLDLLKIHQLQIFSAQEHGYLPLSEVQTFSGIMPGKPLFDSLFVFENYPEGNEKTHELSITRHALGVIEKTEYPMVCAVTLEANALQLQINFKSKNFTPAWVKKLISHFSNVVLQMVAKPQAILSNLIFLTNDDLLYQNSHLNRVASHNLNQDYVHERIAYWAKITPTKAAVLYANKEISYVEFNRRANQIAHYLINKGVGCEVLVAVSLPRSLDQILSIIAILKAGGAYVPLDPNYAEERLNYMITDAMCKHLIVDESTARTFKGYTGEMIVLERIDNELINHPDTNPIVKVNKNDLAYVIYTSGSTGNPKGVMIEHGALCNYLTWAMSAYVTHDNEVFDYSSSLSFDLTITTTLLPLYTGSQMAIATFDVKHNPQDYINHLLQNNVSIIKCTPSYFALFSAYVREYNTIFRYLTKVILGGEQLIRSDLLAFFQFSPNGQVYNEYGPTEATVGCTLFIVNQANINQFSDLIPIGKPISNFKFKIMDHHQRQLPTGTAGQLWIAGIGLSRGYLNQKVLTDKAFVFDNEGERYYQTGDIVKLRDDGELVYLGRNDKLVKIRGYRVELSEIESCLNQIASVSASLVLYNAAQQCLVAYITPHDYNNEPAMHDQLTCKIREHLQQKVPDFMMPNQYIILEQFPLNTNGKIDIKKLPHASTPDSVSVDRYTAPRNLTEYTLLTIWRSIFNINKISIFDSFFDLGGHSLRVIELMLKIKQSLQRDVTIRNIHDYKTITAMSEYLTPSFEVANDDDNKYLLEISKSDTNIAPCFFIHAIEGISYVYSALTPFMEEFTVFAINSRTFTTIETKRPTIEQIASEYIDIILRKQPQGPYRLAGWCFGGKVAYEMGLQLQKRGIAVEVIILIDTYLIETYYTQTLYDAEKFDESIRNYVKEEGVVPGSVQSDFFKYEIKSNMLLSRAYKAQPYSGKIVLIKSSICTNPDDVDFKDPYNNCRSLLANEPEVHMVPCAHSSMFNDKNAPHVAEIIKKVLRNSPSNQQIRADSISFFGNQRSGKNEGAAVTPTQVSEITYQDM